MPSSYTATAADDTNRNKKYAIGHKVGPGVHHDKFLDFFHKSENGHKGKRHQQLSGQHQEYLKKWIILVFINIHDQIVQENPKKYNCASLNFPPFKTT